jgi:hypothetical protein
MSGSIRSNKSFYLSSSSSFFHLHYLSADLARIWKDPMKIIRGAARRRERERKRDRERETATDGLESRVTGWAIIIGPTF